jgi:hypothetical protein
MSLTKTLLVISLVLLSMGTYAQCAQKIDVERTKKADGATLGEFALKIKSDGFKAELIQIDGINESVIKKFSGSGLAVTNTLTGLSNRYAYKVVVEFKGEEKFLCKRKVVLIPVTDSQ